MKLKKTIVTIFIIFNTVNGFCCSLHYSSPWFWKANELVNKSQWIVVGTLKETIRSKEEKYFLIKAEDVIKNVSNTIEFKIGPFAETDEASDKVEKGIDCKLYTNLNPRKKYIFFSESYNRLSILPFSKKEKDNIANILRQKEKK